MAVTLLGWAVLLAGCATSNPDFEAGRGLLAEGRMDEGLARLALAVREAPANAEIRSYYYGQRDRAVNQLLAQAMTARLNGAFDEAEAIYERARKIDPGNQRIAAGMETLAADRRHAAWVQEAKELMEAGDSEKAQALVKRVLAEDPRYREGRALMKRIAEAQAHDVTVGPQLKSRLARPITLEFRDANLRAVFEVISRSAGINFVFDKDVRSDLKATIFVKDTSIEDAIRLLLATNQLERKVLSENSIMIYPNTPAKLRDYQDLVMKSFYLANTDVKQAGNMVRALLKTRDLYVDERLNMLMIRDTPETIRVAEKLIASQDLAEPEAVLEVEVLEVSRGRVQTLGVQWPKQVGYGILQGGATTQSTTGGVVVETTTPGTSVATGVVDLRHNLAGLTTFVANPALLVDLTATSSFANVLANPSIRVKNREKAKIHIGDKVPVLTSTATATGFVSQSVTYLEVGVKLDVEPNIGLEDDVTMKVGLEVSNIASQVTSPSGTVAYQVGSRSAGTTLRLKDGETQVLAGLIQDEDRRNVSKIPGLGDVPLLERLFSDHSDTNNKTEIVLLITPHIVRSLSLPAASVTEFPAGTESSIGRTGSTVMGGPVDVPPPAPEVAPPSPPPPPEAAPAVPAAPAAPEPTTPGGAPAAPTPFSAG